MDFVLQYCTLPKGLIFRKNPWDSVLVKSEEWATLDAAPQKNFARKKGVRVHLGGSQKSNVSRKDVIIFRSADFTHATEPTLDAVLR